MAILQELQSLTKERYVPPANMAILYVGLGDTNSAFQWLDRGYEEHDVMLQWLKVDPIWDPLRSDPRFTALLNRMGLR